MEPWGGPGDSVATQKGIITFIRAAKSLLTITSTDVTSIRELLACSGLPAQTATGRKSATRIMQITEKESSH